MRRFFTVLRSVRAVVAWAAPLLLLYPLWAVKPKAEWAAHLWYRKVTEHRQSPDDARDRAYRDLAPLLPTSGPIGFKYLGGDDGGETQSRVQYALVPRRIVGTTDQEFVVEVGGGDDNPQSLVHSVQFVLVLAHDPMLRLYRRVAR